MTNVISLVPPQKERTVQELLLESQVLSSKALDLLRSSTELVSSFHETMLGITREHLEITSRQSEISQAIQKILYP